MRESHVPRRVRLASTSSTLFCLVLVVSPISQARAGGYGVRQTVGTGTDTITLVQVGGTRYQMGFWYGRLLADEIAACWQKFSAATSSITDADYDTAIAGMWQAAHFDTAAYDSELQGIAAGCSAGGHSEITYEILRKMQVFPDISEHGCSLFAAWGNATVGGHLYQLRNLDWSMDFGIQDYPVIAIYQPDDGNVHAVIGFAGMIGVVGGGINDFGIAESEIMGYFCDAETLVGIPFPILLRDILYHDTTLAQALTRIQTATRTNEYHHGISGPDGAELTARLLFTSNSRCDIYADNESVNPHPCVTPTPFHTGLTDVVYWTRHNGSRNQECYNAINSRYGDIDSAKAIEIGKQLGDTGGETLLSVVYDATTREFWVAYANGTDSAVNQEYVHVDLATPQQSLTALDSYVAAPDANYTYTSSGTIAGTGFTAYVIDMTSQAWRSAAEVTPNVWHHWLTIIKPDSVSSATAFLYVEGGSINKPAPTSVDSNLIAVAVATNSVVADLRQVPNERLKFADETDPRYIQDGRTEDEIISYTFDKYMATGDESWPLLLPMAKSAVRAMDTIQDYLSQSGTTINKFVVAGGSKRGWTTWLTGAVDSRVTAIAPIVIDLLNMDESFKHHFAAYGFYAPAIQDYVDMNIPQRMDTTEGQALLAIVDPYEYRQRFSSMPKFCLNSSGDEFFVPDSSQLYFDNLPGEKLLRYVPNSNHSLDGTDAWESFLAYYASVLAGSTRPSFTWTIQDDESIRVQTTTTPSQVTLWQATNPDARDFRRDTIGAAWTSSTLTAQSTGVYVAQVPEPAQGWTAFFVELQFSSGTSVPYKFSTQVHVVPDILPFGITDCNNNGVNDDDEISLGTAQDCNANDVPDDCDLADGTSRDENGNSIPDECEPDCNNNDTPDDLDITRGTSKDNNGNDVPDECETDCNDNGIADYLDLDAGTSLDCNGNNIPDECDIAAGTSHDENTNSIPDDCETDCNGNGIPDPLDIARGTSKDCNDNNVPDECDIAAGTSLDDNGNLTPDECDPDCNGNGVSDDIDIAQGTSADCNANGVPDKCDISSGAAIDRNANNVPDECDPDCNDNGIPDQSDIVNRTSTDCDANGVPDECQADCNTNGIADACDIEAGTSGDCNRNGIPDECDIARKTLTDADGNGVPDRCEVVLTVNVGEGGTVQKSPDKAGYSVGEVIELTAASAKGWQFAGWSGDLTALSSHITFSLDQSMTLTAAFTNSAPIAVAGGPYHANVNENVTFDASASSDPLGETLTVLWDFGDGTSSDQIAPTHAYAKARIYYVTLTVTDSSGKTDEARTIAEIVPVVPDDGDDGTTDEPDEPDTQEPSSSTSTCGLMDLFSFAVLTAGLLLQRRRF